MLQLGKEEFIDILKDQHPNFNQSASNGVLVSLNENICSGCTAFKIFISILFTAFDDLKSWVRLLWTTFTGSWNIWNWQPELLLTFAPAKTARLFTSDAPSGPRSWFKLACATEREFIDVVCSTASGVNSSPLDVGFSCKWCESDKAENFWASCGVRLRMYDICRRCCLFADLYDCKLWLFLCPLNWATKFYGVLASSSLNMLVFRTEWLLTFVPILCWMPVLSAAVLSNFPIWFLPSGALMYQISLFSRRMKCLKAKNNSEFGCFISTGRWSRKSL